MFHQQYYLLGFTLGFLFLLCSGCSESEESSIQSATEIKINTDSVVTSERGGWAEFSVSLTNAPRANVVIPLEIDNPHEGNVEPTQILFDIDSWQEPQKVRVTGVDDDVADGNQNYKIHLLAAISRDPQYRGILPGSVDVLNTDDEIPGIFLSTREVQTSETGKTASFTVRLQSRPLEDVIIQVKITDLTEGQVQPDSFIFTPDNWSKPQIVTVQGVDDEEVDGPQSYSLELGPTISKSLIYNGVTLPFVTVINLDDESSGFIVSTNHNHTAEAGDTASIAVKLTVKPSADVILPVSVSDASEATIAPSELHFTSNQWNQNQTITIKGVDDPETDGNQEFQIIWGPSQSLDSTYQGIQLDPLSFINSDDDVPHVLITLSGTETSETGSSVKMNLRLQSKPAEDVLIHMKSSDLTEGRLSAPSVYFSPDTWNQTQTILIIGVNDEQHDGRQPYEIQFSTIESRDHHYRDLRLESLKLINKDDDLDGISLQIPKEQYTTEKGTQIRIPIKLLSQPQDRIILNFTSTDLSEAYVTPDKMTFNIKDWNSEQWLTIIGLNDDEADGAQAYQVQMDLSQSRDTHYQKIEQAPLVFKNLDDDQVGLLHSEISGNTHEPDGTATFSVRLRSQPKAPVSVTLKSQNSKEGLVTPTRVFFDRNNWSESQIVTVTGQDDFVADGDQPYTLTLGPVESQDESYQKIKTTSLTLKNMDNDRPDILWNSLSNVTSEEGQAAEIEIKLSSQPLSGVQIDVFSSAPDEGQVSTSQVLFTPDDWNQPQLIKVIGVNDYGPDGDQIYFIETKPSLSNDSHYNGLKPGAIKLTNLDIFQIQVSLGMNHACRLSSSGRVECWGKGESGQLGAQGVRTSQPPILVQELNDAKQIAAGTRHTCALSHSGTVKCWGSNDLGQLGDGGTRSKFIPVQVRDLINVERIDIGVAHSCAVTNEGSLFCWGDGFYGQLGNDSSVMKQSIPIKVKNINEVQSVALGEHHSCGVVKSGEVYCWGIKDYAQQGRVALHEKNGIPEKIEGIKDAIEISAGLHHTCVLLKNRKVQCWGEGKYGQLGDGKLEGSLKPVFVSALAEVSQLASGESHNCALLNNGDVHCWGRGTEGQLKKGGLKNEPVPILVTPENIMQIQYLAAGGSSTCIITATGDVSCWGSLELIKK
ncbi:Calx-beta domain-containing protein [Deltaproteobacteria bacterium TL4]